MNDLRELEDMLRRGGVAIAPERPDAPETVELPITDAQGNEVGKQTLTLSVQNQRQVKGFVTLYNTRTGEPIPVDINRVTLMLRKTHRDSRYPDWVGKLAYTLDPSRAPKQQLGQYKCPLHPDSPDHDYYLSLGAEPCYKTGIPHLLAVDAHLRIKHPQTWRFMQQQEQRAAQDEERRFRQWMMAQSANGAPWNVPTPNVGKPAEPVTEGKVYTETCEECGETFTASAPVAAGAKKRGHLKTVHGK